MSYNYYGTTPWYIHPTVRKATAITSTTLLPTVMISILLLCLQYVHLAHCSVNTTSSTPFHFLKNISTAPLISVENNTASSLNSSTNFRVAWGEPVYDMKGDNYNHLVRIFLVTETKQVENSNLKQPAVPVLIGSCAGMKVTANQLRHDKQQEINSITGTVQRGQYVLTAGHCIEKAEMAEVPDPENPDEHIEIESILRHLIVVSGHADVPYPKVRLQTDPKTPLEVIFVDHLQGSVSAVEWVSYDYPNDEGDKYDEHGNIIESNDIAILKLVKPFLTKVIPLKFDKKEPTGNEHCRFAGWGDDEDGESVSQLMKVKKGNRQMQLLDTDKCQKLIYYVPQATSKLFWKQRICTKHPKGRMPCDGDSGGPLMCREKGKSTVEKVWGVFSSEPIYNTPCSDNPDQSQRMNLYINVASDTNKDYLQRCIEVMERPKTEMETYWKVKKCEDESKVENVERCLALAPEHWNQKYVDSFENCDLRWIQPGTIRFASEDIEEEDEQSEDEMENRPGPCSANGEGLRRSDTQTCKLPSAGSSKGLQLYVVLIAWYIGLLF